MLFKAIKFELSKFFYNKKNTLYFLILILIFFVFCLSYKNIISLTNYIIDNDKLYENNILMRDSYKFQYEIAYGIIEKPNNIILPESIFSMKEELKYQYLYNHKSARMSDIVLITCFILCSSPYFLPYIFIL